MYAATDPTPTGPHRRRRRAHRSTCSSSAPARRASPSATTWPGTRHAVPPGRRRPRDRAQLAHPMGLAAAVHPRRVLRAARAWRSPPRRAPTRARTRSPSYLKAYAARFDLPVMLNTRSPSTSTSSQEAACSGSPPARAPCGPGRSSSPPARSSSPPSPRVGSGFAAAVTQLHSSTYRNPTDLPRRTPGRSWWSAPGTPASRSRSSSAAPTRSTSPSAPGRRPCRSGRWAATCSGGSPRPGS